MGTRESDIGHSPCQVRRDRDRDRDRETLLWLATSAQAVSLFIFFQDMLLK
jgi:hypothetical protein